MADQLYVYNRALQILKSTALASLSEVSERRVVLDANYNELLTAYLEEGFWKFAIRSVKIEADTDITPGFGYTYAFNQPEDLRKTYQVASDEFFLNMWWDDWIEESNLWWANVDEIYVRYVSDDATYGLDLTKWTGRYTEAFCHQLAYRCAGLVSGSDPEKLLKEAVKTRSEALQFEAHREPAKRQPEGRWNRARHNLGWGGRRYLRA